MSVVCICIHVGARMFKYMHVHMHMKTRVDIRCLPYNSHLIFWGKGSQLAYSSWFRYSGWPGNFQDLPASHQLWVTSVHHCTRFLHRYYDPSRCFIKSTISRTALLSRWMFLSVTLKYIPSEIVMWGFHSMYFSGRELWPRNHHFGFKPQHCHFLSDMWPVASHVTLRDCFLWRCTVL